MTKFDDIFISYSHEDKVWVSKLVTALRENGYRVWMDVKIRSGKNIDDAIELKLKEARCVLVIWSPSSVKSSWVRSEAAWANDQEKLIAIRLSKEVDIPLQFYRQHVASFVEWDGARSHHAFKKLVTDINSFNPSNGEPNSNAICDYDTSNNDIGVKKLLSKRYLALLAGLLLTLLIAYFYFPQNQKLRSAQGVLPSTSNLEFNFGLFSGQRAGQWRRIEPGQVLRSHDLYWLKVESLQDAYLYIFQQDSEGQIDRLYPRTPEANPVKSSSNFTIPERGAFELDDQQGRERIYFIGRPVPDECLDSMPERLLPTQTNPCPRWFDVSEPNARALTPDFLPGGRGMNAVVSTEVTLGCEACTYYIEFDHN